MAFREHGYDPGDKVKLISSKGSRETDINEKLHAHVNQVGTVSQLFYNMPLIGVRFRDGVYLQLYPDEIARA